MTTSTVATVAAISQVRSGQHEQSRVRVEISGLPGPHGHGVAGEDPVPPRVARVQPPGVGLVQWPIGQPLYRHRVMIRVEPAVLRRDAPASA